MCVHGGNVSHLQGFRVLRESLTSFLFAVTLLKNRFKFLKGNENLDRQNIFLILTVLHTKSAGIFDTNREGFEALPAQRSLN